MLATFNFDLVLNSDSVFFADTNMQNIHKEMIMHKIC
jgi:hypothetical protein